MTDKQFMNELWIRGYIDQIAGYPLGHPGRENFNPIIPFNQDSDNGPVNRERTLENPCYHLFTADDRKMLLKRD